MAVTLRYFIEFGKPVFQHNNRVDLWRNSCTSLLYFIVRVRRRRYVSSRSLSHLLTGPSKSRGGGKGVSYPGPRIVGGAPRSLRMIFLSPFTGNTKADNSKLLNYFALLNDICTGQLL